MSALGLCLQLWLSPIPQDPNIRLYIRWGVQGVFWGLWEAGKYGAALAGVPAMGQLLEVPSSSGLLGPLFQSFEKYCKGAGRGGPGGARGGDAEHGPSSS